MANAGAEVQFFAALETDKRGLAPFHHLTKRLDQLGGNWWFFSFDDGAREINTENRLIRIMMGKNLCSSYSMQSGASHMLLMDADIRPDPETFPKLLEMDWPVVGGEVPSYGLQADLVTNHPTEGWPFTYPVQDHMTLAGFSLVRREVFCRIPWRIDLDRGMTEDTAMRTDMKELLGLTTLVRKDVLGHHYPEVLDKIENRPHDRRVYH
jgi:hypothetical protein